MARRESARRHYTRNREAINARSRERMKRGYDYVWAHKSAHPCVDCGEKDPVVLTYDHVRGVKIKAVADMFSYAIVKIQAEIDKCEVRCANCHLRRHAVEGKPGKQGRPITVGAAEPLRPRGRQLVKKTWADALLI